MKKVVITLGIVLTAVFLGIGGPAGAKTDPGPRNPKFICGDVNHDGIINLADISILMRYLCVGGGQSNPGDAGDVNHDGRVDIGDAVYLFAYLIKGGPPPAHQYGPEPASSGKNR